MKNTLLVFILVLFFGSCKSDDDSMVMQCLEPVNIQVSNVTANSIAITWNSDSENYAVEYGLAGFTIGSGTVINTDTTSAMLTGLTGNTSYDVYIQSICSTSNVSMKSEAINFTTVGLPVVPQFLPTLSELNIFSGDLKNLAPSSFAFEYSLTTPLFSDYSMKKRLIALPEGTTMDFVDDKLPNFPENTLMAKTFYYNADDRDESLGKTVIETRVFIIINGEWQSGNYKWNESQTEAFLTTESSTLPISYIDIQGNTRAINYKIPGVTDCIECHSNGTADIEPIGPKLRALNLNNQLQELIDANYLSGITDVSSVTSLPAWDDDSFSIEERTRAYFDMQCAHCHSVGGSCENQSDLRLGYEIPYAETEIFGSRDDIIERCRDFAPQFSMPNNGTTIIHEEGFELMEIYINSL